MAAMLFPPNRPQTPPLPPGEDRGEGPLHPQIPPKRKGETWRPPLEFVVLSHRS